MSNCLTCVFFSKDKENENGVFGFCRRFPPVLSVLGGEDKLEAEQDDGQWLGRYEREFVHWVQPAVCDTDWCGEYNEQFEEADDHK